MKHPGCIILVTVASLLTPANAHSLDYEWFDGVRNPSEPFWNWAIADNWSQDAYPSGDVPGTVNVRLTGSVTNGPTLTTDIGVIDSIFMRGNSSIPRFDILTGGSVVLDGAQAETFVMTEGAFLRLSGGELSLQRGDLTLAAPDLFDTRIRPNSITVNSGLISIEEGSLNIGKADPSANADSRVHMLGGALTVGKDIRVGQQLGPPLVDTFVRQAILEIHPDAASVIVGGNNTSGGDLIVDSSGILSFVYDNGLTPLSVKSNNAGLHGDVIIEQGGRIALTGDFPQGQWITLIHLDGELINNGDIVPGSSHRVQEGQLQVLIPVPEPATGGILALGLWALLTQRWRQ